MLFFQKIVATGPLLTIAYPVQLKYTYIKRRERRESEQRSRMTRYKQGNTERKGKERAWSGDGGKGKAISTDPCVLSNVNHLTTFRPFSTIFLLRS
jgi:hypothetical protein